MRLPLEDLRLEDGGGCVQSTPPTPPTAPGFEHEALMYAGDGGFLAAAVPFVAAALDADEPVLVALPRARVEVLTNALGDRAAEVQFLAMEEVGRNPACIIPAWLSFVDRRPPDGRAIHGIGEPVWGGRDPAEYTECHLHESLLNEAFTGTSAFRLLCPYDTQTLDAETVEEARRTHPIVQQAGSRQGSSSYSAVDARDRHFRAPLPEPTTDVWEVPVSGISRHRDLRNVRGMVADHGRSCGLQPIRVNDLVLAVDEIMINAVSHGGGRGTLRMWRAGERAVCEVRDEGRLEDAMVGRLPPSHTSRGGRGLWLVNQLCDLVQIRSTATGTVVRVEVRPSGA
jgi:anti-sigma regulatory factor (Ser/Thr protein kinase)